MPGTLEKMKVSRTFSLPIDVLETLGKYARDNDVNESEACRVLLRAGFEALFPGKKEMLTK